MCPGRLRPAGARAQGGPPAACAVSRESAGVGGVAALARDRSRLPRARRESVRALLLRTLRAVALAQPRSITREVDAWPLARLGRLRLRLRWILGCLCK